MWPKCIPHPNCLSACDGVLYLMHYSWSCEQPEFALLYESGDSQHAPSATARTCSEWLLSLLPLEKGVLGVKLCPMVTSVTQTPTMKTKWGPSYTGPWQFFCEWHYVAQSISKRPLTSYRDIHNQMSSSFVVDVQVSEDGRKGGWMLGRTTEVEGAIIHCS